MQQMALDRALGDEQALGDLAVGQATGGQARAAALLRGEGIDAGRGRPAGTRASSSELTDRAGDEQAPAA